MNKKYLIAIYLIIFELLSMNLISQPDKPPCTDCWNVKWSIDTEIGSFPDSLCPNCYISYEYWYRFIEDTCKDLAAAIGTKDLQLRFVESSPGCDLCYSKQEIYEIAIKHLLTNNVLLNHRKPQYDTLWRVFQTSCWGEWWDEIDQVYKIRGCLPDDNCCWEQYALYANDYYHIDSVKLLRKLFQPGHPFDGCDKWTTPCWFTCDSAYEPPPPPLIFSVKGFNSFVYSQVIPNPNNGNFDLELNNFNNNEIISIRIHTIDGTLIKEIKNIITTNKKVIKISIDNYPPGFYYYKITRNNKVIDFGKFIVN